MSLDKLLKAATPLPWHIQAGASKMSAIVGQNDNLIAGSLICQQGDKQDIIDHKLIVHAVNLLPELVAAMADLLDQLEGVGIAEPECDEGQWHGTEGLTFGRARAALAVAQEVPE